MDLIFLNFRFSIYTFKTIIKKPRYTKISCIFFVLMTKHLFLIKNISNIIAFILLILEIINN